MILCFSTYFESYKDFRVPDIFTFLRFFILLRIYTYYLDYILFINFGNNCYQVIDHSDKKN